MNKKVIIMGGGVAGMSAAHELVERGYQVEVFDRNPIYVGGKARSVNVWDTNLVNPHLYLPGEHGFRFFPGFYKHVTDTMKRIPKLDGEGSCFDNLVSTESVMIAQGGSVKPIVVGVNFPSSIKDIKRLLYSYKVVKQELTSEEIHFFAERVWQLMSSSNQRFLDEYEGIGWWEYCAADKFSKAYQDLLVIGLTRSLVAANAKLASTHTVGRIFLQLIYLMADANANDTDRVLNAPTNDAWLNPWLDYLTKKGVKYHKGYIVTDIEMTNGAISGITTDTEGVITTHNDADYYILATPVERAATLLNEAVLTADPSLKSIITLAPNVEWMNGLQFYLNEEVNLNKGHTIYANSNWALTSISQLQFWKDYDIQDRGNGKIKSILSVDISNWQTEGNFNQKTATECSSEEVKDEVWRQIKAELNKNGHEILKDTMIDFWYLDKDIRTVKVELTPEMLAKLTEAQVIELKKVINLEPLLVNQIHTWGLRPNSFTNIPNLFLASDYVKTNTDLATMEGANEAARRAVNDILDKDGQTNYCKIWTLYNPTALRLAQWYDKKRFKKGLQWTGKLPFWIEVLTFILSIVHTIKGLLKRLFT